MHWSNIVGFQDAASSTRISMTWSDPENASASGDCDGMTFRTSTLGIEDPSCGEGIIIRSTIDLAQTALPIWRNSMGCYFRAYREPVSLRGVSFARSIARTHRIAIHRHEYFQRPSNRTPVKISRRVSTVSSANRADHWKQFKSMEAYR